MTKKFSLLQLFSIVDGRLSTSMDDVYLMFNHICDDNLMTHHLPVAMDYLISKNPIWFQDVRKRIEDVKILLDSNDFETLINHIKNNINDVYDIPQLSDEFDTSDFVNYMVSNSLLFKIGSNK